MTALLSDDKGWLSLFFTVGSWLDEPRLQQERASRRNFGITLALSLAVHALVLSLVLQRVHTMSPEEGSLEEPGERMSVRLAEAPRPVPAPVPVPPIPKAIVPKAPARPPKATERIQRPPPVIASPAPALPMPAPAPQPPAPRAPEAAKPSEGDLWSYLQARRRERGEPTDSLQANPALNAAIAANLPRAATGVANADPRHSGGIFEIKRMTYDDAAFVFFGWNQDMGRQTPQLVEVRIGNNANMRIAVIRKMIAIIREYEHGNFIWRSAHGTVTLSAALEDNDALEAYLLREFDEDFGLIR